MSRTLSFFSERFPQKKGHNSKRQSPTELRPDPLVQLYETAQNIYSKFKENQKDHQNELLANTLYEILACHMRFLAGIYLSIFLRKDYQDDEMDGRVLNYFKGIYNSYNELLGLCEELCKFLSRENLEIKVDDRLFRVRFDSLRLKAPPFIAHQYDDYNKHVMDVMETFRSEARFLKTSQIKIEDIFPCWDDHKIYQRTAEKLIRKNQLKRNPLLGLKQKSGKCFIIFEHGDPIRLDPIIIPLLKRSQEVRFASIARFSGYQSYDQCPIVYRVLTGCGIHLNTNNSILFRRLFQKKGLVSETPSFSHQFSFPGSKIQIQLYKGDIFDLNFLEGCGEKESAMVNLLHADLSNKTLLSKTLENLAGNQIMDELIEQATQKKHKFYSKLKGHIQLQKDHIYITSAGHLKFKYVFHCPIYDFNEKKDSKLEVIKQAIRKILKECIEKRVEQLVVPALGSFWAGQTRQEVANNWCDEIQNYKGLRDSLLKRIIFSFINEETCEVYRKCIHLKTGERFASYHLPVSRMHNHIITTCNNKDRLNLVLDLSTYLYGFIVAWVIRSMMWERFLEEENGRKYSPTDDQRKFLEMICQISGLSPMKKEWFKSMNVGDWRSLAWSGYSAIRDMRNKWSFDKWFANSDKNSKKIFKMFLTSGEIDFGKLRNQMAHAKWHTIKDSSISEQTEKAVQHIEMIIENMPFLKHQQNQMVLMEGFSVNEDTGMCRLTYRDLSGEHAEPQQKFSDIKIKNLGGRLFETGTVYLIEGLANSSIKALNMHPFILYGECPGCHSNKLFVWRDLFLKNVDDKIEIKYGSTTCDCKQIDDDKIAGFNHWELNRRYNDIVKQLKPYLYSTE